MLDLIIFLLFFYFCLFSVLGYGLIFQNLFYTEFIKKKRNLDLSLNGFYGLTLITIISFVTSFFFAHGFIHNVFLHFVGFSYFFFFSNIKKIRYIKYLFTISLLVLSGLLISKTHDDFSYYHLPFTKYLTEHHIIFGMGHLNLGYNFISSLFFLNSSFYLPIINYFSFHFSNLYFLIFFNYFLIENLLIKKNKKFINSLCLIAFIFFNLSFNRISEYGTDKVGQLLIVLLVISLIRIILFEFKTNKIYQVLLLLPLLGFCITLKTYFVSYIMLSFSLLLISTSIKKDFKSIINSRAFFIFVIILFLNFSHHFITNACIISPLSKTCFGENFIWGKNIKEILDLQIWVEQWAKAGAGPGFRVDNVSDYLKDFNWVTNWFEKYFIIKFLDQILLYTFSLFLFFIFTKKFQLAQINLSKSYLNRKFFAFYIFIIIIFFIWFSNHPTLRYGGYSAFFLFASIPILILFDFFKDKKFEKNKIIFILFFVALLFNIKNFSRIYQEFNRDDHYRFSNFPYFAIKQKNYKIIKFDDISLYSTHHCWATPSPCGNAGDGIKIIKKMKHFYIFKIDK